MEKKSSMGRRVAHLEDGGAEGDFQVLLHMGGEGGSSADDEAHAAAKGLLERAEQVPVQQRGRLRPTSCISPS